MQEGVGGGQLWGAGPVPVCGRTAVWVCESVYVGRLPNVSRVSD